MSNTMKARTAVGRYAHALVAGALHANTHAKASEVECELLTLLIPTSKEAARGKPWYQDVARDLAEALGVLWWEADIDVTQPRDDIRLSPEKGRRPRALFAAARRRMH